MLTEQQINLIELEHARSLCRTWPDRAHCAGEQDGRQCPLSALIATLREAQAEARRLREALAVAGPGLAATYAMLEAAGDHDGATGCMHMIDVIDAALAEPADTAENELA